MDGDRNTEPDNRRIEKTVYPDILPVRIQLRGDWENTFRAMQRIDNTFSSWVTRTILGYAALALNKPSVVIEILTVDRAQIIDWQPHLTNLAIAYHMLGRHTEELEVAQEHLEKFPTQLDGIVNVMRAQSALGEAGEVSRLIDQAFSVPVPEGTDRAMVVRDACLELRAHGFRSAADSLLPKAFAWYDTRVPAEKKRFRFGRARMHYFAGELDKAKEIFLELEKELPDHANIKGYLGLIAAHEGHRTEALRISEWMLKQEKPYSCGGYTIWRSYISAQLGEKEQAVVLLRDGFSQGYAHGIWTHRNTPLDVLRDYPPFVELIKPREH